MWVWCVWNGTVALHDDINGPIQLLMEVIKMVEKVGVYHKTELWIDDVMDYFGEFIDKEQASDLLQESKGIGYFEVMHGIRSKLLDMGYSVPFRAVYRRTKDERR